MSVFNVDDYIGRRLPTQCCAHRGFSGWYPENTLLAFRKAVESGADMIEMDVRTSKDGELVLIHDSTVDRTTNSSGDISELTLEEIEMLSAGWGEKIPTFKEMIEEMAGQIGMNIHMKTQQPKVVDETIEYCADFGILEQVFFSIRSADEIRRIRKKYRNVHVCSFYHVNQPDYLKVTLELGARILQPGFNPTYLTRDWVERVHESSCVCNVFYADTVSNLLYCQYVGVDAVLTNFPDTFLKVFER